MSFVVLARVLEVTEWCHQLCADFGSSKGGRLSLLLSSCHADLHLGVSRKTQFMDYEHYTMLYIGCPFDILICEKFAVRKNVDFFPSKSE